MRLQLPRPALALLPALCIVALLGAAPAPSEQAPKSKAAFFYKRDKEAAEAFKKLLDDEKLPTDLIAVGDLGTADEAVHAHRGRAGHQARLGQGRGGGG